MEKWEHNSIPKNTNAITMEKRDSLMRFNTPEYWWCFYDKTNDKLYSQFCDLLLENAYTYLLKNGLITKDREKIKMFLD